MPPPSPVLLLTFSSPPYTLPPRKAGSPGLRIERDQTDAEAEADADADRLRSTRGGRRAAGGGRRMPRVFTGFQRASFNLFRLWPSAFGRSDRPFTRLMILGPQSRNHNFPCKPIRQRTLLTFRNLYDNEFMRSIVPLLSFGALHVCSGWVMFLGLWRPWKWWASRRRISEITKRSQCT